MSFFGFSILDLKKTIHFTSLHFHSLGVRPAFYCGVMMRGLYGVRCTVSIYGAVVLWYCLWRCLWRCLYIYLENGENGEMGENGEKKNLPWLYLGLPGLLLSLVSCRVLSCARFSCTPRCGRIRIRVRSRFRRLRSPSSRSHRHRCRRRYIRRCAAEIGG